VTKTGSQKGQVQNAPLFFSMDALDKFFRIYLRARGLPEKIGRNLNEHIGLPLEYGDLESPPTQSTTPEEAMKMANSQNSEQA